jgi:hypothetical protein
VKNYLYPGKYLAQPVRITHVAYHKFYIRRKVIRSTLLMNLRGKIVEDADLVPCCEKAVCEVGADKPGAAGNKDLPGSFRRSVHVV